VQLFHGLVTGAMYGVGAYFVITINGIANTSGQKGRRLLKSALLFLVLIPVVAGFLTGLLGIGNDTTAGSYIGSFAYISGIAGVFLLAKGVRQAILEAAMQKELEAEEE